MSRRLTQTLKNHPLLFASFCLAILILVAAITYRHLQQSTTREVLTPITFQPLEGTLRDVIDNKVKNWASSSDISTTQPVSASFQLVPFGETAVIDDHHDHENDSDVHSSFENTPVKNAYIVKYQNTEICSTDGACPMAIIAAKPGPEKVYNPLMLIKAKSIQISSKNTSGNPDLIVDYGNGQQYRMVWSGGDLADYITIPPSAESSR